MEIFSVGNFVYVRHDACLLCLYVCHRPNIGDIRDRKSVV